MGIPHSITDSARIWLKGGGIRQSMCRPGWPDIVGCLEGGRLLAVECKGSSGKLRPEQTETLKALDRQGALVIVAFDPSEVEVAIEHWREFHQGIQAAIPPA